MAKKKTAARRRGAKTARKPGVKASAGKRKAAAGRSGGKARQAKKSEKKTTGGGAEELLTLTEVGRLASVSMPTLQKYKKVYADRIPSVGEGRRQRYPREAVAVLRQLKKENLARRGRPPKAGGSPRAAGAKRRARKAAGSNLLTLTEISRRTGISYPTVSRYVKLFLDRIPHVGSGRQRRFPPEAVAAFSALRRESRPGRPAGAGGARSRRAGASEAALAARLRKLERAQVELGRQVASLVKLVKKPLKVTIKR